MDTYSLLREIADSWALLALFGFFIGAVIWAFRPGSQRVHKETANIPFLQHDDKPASDDYTLDANGQEAQQ
jgi:cytochrome c oxidase cbb3-type subunit 4